MKNLIHSNTGIVSPLLRPFAHYILHVMLFFPLFHLLFFLISILYPFKLANVLCKCSASGDMPRAFQQPNIIPIIWVLNLSAVRCWFTTDNWTSGFKAFDEDITNIVSRSFMLTVQSGSILDGQQFKSKDQRWVFRFSRFPLFGVLYFSFRPLPWDERFICVSICLARVCC